MYLHCEQDVYIHSEMYLPCERDVYIHSVSTYPVREMYTFSVRCTYPVSEMLVKKDCANDASAKNNQCSNDQTQVDVGACAVLSVGHSDQLRGGYFQF